MRQMLKEFEEKPAEITEQSRLDLQGLSRKEQRRIKKEQLAETIADMTPFQKFKYLLYFYKELIIVAIIVIAALWFITSNAYRVTRPVTISYSIINCGDSLEFHPEPFTEYAEAIGKRKGYQIKGDSNVVITGEENSGKYEANINGEIFVNFMNLVGSDYYDVLFTDDVAARFCTNVDVFTPLNEYLDAKNSGGTTAHPIAKFISNNLKNDINTLLGDSKCGKGSAGIGNLANMPWLDFTIPYSMDKIGSVVSNIVNNLFDQNKLEQDLDQLDELDLSDLEGNKIIVNDDINNNTKVIINNKEVNRDIFDPIFNSFGLIFNDEFANNFLQNFPSSNGNYYENMQNIANDNQQYSIENNIKLVKEDVLSK